MSFRIKSTHKFVNSPPAENEDDNGNVLSTVDDKAKYQPSTSNTVYKEEPTKYKGGNVIRQSPLALGDFQ